jgi:hypothetical protein
MRTFVWVDAWQQQCCGDEFEVGSTVTWDITRQPDSEWVKLLLGDTWARRVEYREEHHDDASGSPLTGQVISIQVVTCSRQPEQKGSGTVLTPVPGSGTLRQVQMADPWEPEHLDQVPMRSFDGWIVELEVPQPTT